MREMPITIEDVEKLLSGKLILRPPKHIFISSERVFGRINGLIELRGAAQYGGSAIFLSASATMETVVEEILHTMFIGERIVKPLTKIILSIPTIFKRKVEYIECKGNCGIPHEHLPVKHYILKEVSFPRI